MDRIRGVNLKRWAASGEPEKWVRAPWKRSLCGLAAWKANQAPRHTGAAALSGKTGKTHPLNLAPGIVLR